MPARDGTGPPSGLGQRGGRGVASKSGAGPVGLCVCSKCGHSVAHTRGRPCKHTECPKCGSPMMRK